MSIGLGVGGQEPALGLAGVGVAVIGQDQWHRSAAAAARIGAQFSRALGVGRRARPDDWRLAITVCEFLLLLILALLAARLFWTAFEPLPAIEALAPGAARRPIPVSVGDPFRTAGAPSAGEMPNAAAANTSLNLTLRGTWVDTKRASAVIATPDGKQKAYFIGDSICCGASLVEVLRDEVIILRGGVREALHLPAVTEDRAAPAAPPAGPPASDEAEDLSAIVRIEPKLDATGIAEVRLHPGAEAARFTALGFYDGDKLIAINNQPLPTSPADLTEMVQGLRGQTHVGVTVERNGVRLAIDVPLSGGK